ncbi:chaperonin 10-like protein [Aspergillus caelatus]|uniref:Chaperonin 10-like protein n=1 Tax=Aspergillus caelatus TaxID=61420 RepID=A0A5N7AE27_9EURO|nr:chaperonin 10-like protein [Aspergillus caelatus]KAE8368114.1 chaperonin 10-like protein [Aspergillus caelatus]
MQNMRAVVFQGPGNIIVEDRAVPQILDPKDAIIKVKVAGVCGSDLHFYRGHEKVQANFIPGHEFVGSVHAIGADIKKLKVGDDVVSPFTTQCGNCYYCERGQTSRCEKGLLFGSCGTGPDGGQAEFVRVPFADSTLVHAPGSISSDLLILMSDIFPTGYFCASRFLKNMSAQEAQNSVVAVVGCGPVGICAIASALTCCPNVYAIDMVPSRLAEAEKIGAKPLLLDKDPESTIKAATGGRGADVALEVVGTEEAMQVCLSLIRPFGFVSCVGVRHGDYIIPGSLVYSKNATIAWGRCPVGGIFEEALGCLVKVQDKVSFLCDLHMSLEDAPRAYDIFNRRKVHKVILKV